VKIIEDYHTEAKGKQKKISLFVMVGKALLEDSLRKVRSPDRSPVVSLGIFSEAYDKSMCPGSTQPLEMSTRIFLGVKAAVA
jgi:hypothetical protein